MEDAGFHAGEGGEELFLAVADAGEVLVGAVDVLHLEAGGETRAFEQFHETLGGVVPGTEADCAEGDIHDVGTRFNDAYEADEGGAGGGMDVDVDRKVRAEGGLDAADEVVGGLGLRERGHILDADGIGTKAGKVFGEANETLNGVFRADGVA